MPETREKLTNQAEPGLTRSNSGNLPALVPVPTPRRARRNWRERSIALLVLVAVAAGAAYWLFHPRPGLPPGFASGNGRLEADEVDIDTKFAGRIAELRVDEGDMVKAGQLVAVMDTRDLQAQLKQYQQVVLQDQRTLDQAKANYTQQLAVLKFDQQELARTSQLVPEGFATVEMLDRQTQDLNSATATLKADEAAIGAAQHALEAAQHQVEFYAVEIADDQLVAPKNGPIEYRAANLGEVLAVGGKIFTMLDASYVYMDIYLPTEQAGRIRIGAEARIVLDAYPTHVIPAHVVFVASQAQFTPKAVETKEERDKLMFRLRVRIDPDRLQGREAIVRSGLPGLAYVRLDQSAKWPANLAPSAPPPVPTAVSR
jgi:HlyD family secretion protein